MGSREMADDKWISVADAADFLGSPHGKRLVNLAWKSGFIRLYGTPAGESESVEIPLNEGGRVNCKKSCIVIGRLCRMYHDVTVNWVDVKRLTQVDVTRLAEEARMAASFPTEPARQTPSSTDVLEAKVGPLVKTVALELRHHFPEGRWRGLTRDELALYVHKKSEGKIAVISPATLDRAVALAWPRSEPSRAPKAAKPPR
jgi:hypothetical protein